MKINKKYWIIILFLFLAVSLIYFLRQQHPLPQKTQQPTKELILNTQDNYEVSYANTFSIQKKDGSISKVTIVASNGDFTPTPRLDIYEDAGLSYTKIYSLIPDIPDSKGFSIRIYAVTPITDNGDPFTSLSGILLSLSKTGADYWGDYPVLVKYDKEKGFSLTYFYSGNLSERPEIKTYMSLPDQDVEVTNQLNKNEKERTLLTHGVSLSYDPTDVNLNFYADHNCHACEHNIVTIRLPIDNLR